MNTAKKLVLAVLCALPAWAGSAPNALPGEVSGHQSTLPNLSNQDDGMLLAQAAAKKTPRKRSAKRAIEKRNIAPAENNTDSANTVEGQDTVETMLITPQAALAPNTKADEQPSTAKTPAPAPVRTGFRDSGGKGNVNVTVGTRNEKLDWSISQFGGHPNILSELTYDADMTELRIAEDFTFNFGLAINAEYAYAVAYKGKERDSDYDFDNRQGEFSRSYAKLKDSTAQRASLGIGWHFLPHRIISLRPQVGYAWSETDFHAKKGYQAVSGPSVNYPSLGVPPVGSTLDGLDSRYKPTTYGPWVGFQVGLHPARWLDLKADVKYQWAKYTADANWNLRSDLQHPKSFRHSGDIQGWQVGGEAAWNITSHHAIIAGVEWSKKSLSGGKDKTYFANGYVSEIKLRRVNQESLSANLGYRFSF